MAIDALSSSTLNASTAAATTDASAIAEDFDAFLQLLTAQLKNQDPLEPMDTNEFTNQLVQFSSVEQELKANENLEKLLALSTSNATSMVVGYIGKSVTATGSSSYLKDGAVKWSFDLPTAAPDTTVSIRDAAGSVVFSENISLGSGAGSYRWDGTKSDGSTAPDGVYSITIDAKDADGNHVSADTSLEGIVDSIDLSGSEPVATISGVRVNISNIKEISLAESG